MPISTILARREVKPGFRAEPKSHRFDQTGRLDLVPRRASGLTANSTALDPKMDAFEFQLLDGRSELRPLKILQHSTVANR